MVLSELLNYDSVRNTFEVYAGLSEYVCYDVDKQMILQMSNKTPRYVPIYLPE